MYKILINCFCLLLLMGCQKDEIVERPPNNNFPVENNGVIWQSALTDDGSISRSIDPIIFDNNLFVSSRKTSDNEVLKNFEKSNGELKWEWSEYINPNPSQDISGANSIIIIDDILVANSAQDHYGIDIETGISKWSTIVEHRDERFSSFENNYIHTTSYGHNSLSDSTTVSICNPQNGECKERLKFVKKDDFEVRICPPVFFRNTDNDTLVIFQNRQFVVNPSARKVDLHCYNITQKRMEWEHLEVDQWGNSNIRAPLIDGDYCYFVGLASAYCFNIYTGEKIWQYDHNVAWQLSNFIIHENNFIIKDDQSNLLAINKYNGQLSWKNEDASGCCVTMRLYGDRIYFANAGLFIVDARTGEILYRDLESPNKEAYPGAVFRNTVAVDLEQKIMYATDGYFVMAMELPE